MRGAPACAWSAPTITSYWNQRLTGAADRARRCPAVTQDWWRRGDATWPTASEHHCPLHDGRLSCLLTAARRALTAGTSEAGGGRGEARRETADHVEEISAA